MAWPNQEEHEILTPNRCWSLHFRFKGVYGGCDLMVIHPQKESLEQAVGQSGKNIKGPFRLMHDLLHLNFIAYPAFPAIGPEPKPMDQYWCSLSDDPSGPRTPPTEAETKGPTGTAKRARARDQCIRTNMHAHVPINAHRTCMIDM